MFIRVGVAGGKGPLEEEAKTRLAAEAGEETSSRIVIAQVEAAIRGSNALVLDCKAGITCIERFLELRRLL